MASKSSGLSILVVGAGAMGFNHARVFADSPRVAHVMVCDPMDAALERVKTLGNQKITVTKDLDEALKKKFDAASVAAPTHQHYSVASKLIEHGIPALLVEKPICASVEEGVKLVALAEKKKVLMLVGHIERFNPAVQTLKKHVAQIGPIVYASTHRFGIPTQRDLGDAFFDQAVHDIDVLSFLSGHHPKTVSAMARRVLDSKSNDLVTAIFDYGPFPAAVEANRVTPIKTRELIVLGTQGAAKLDYISQELVIYKSDKTETKFSSFDEIVMRVGRGTEIRPYFTKDEPLKVELNHFLDCVEGKAKPQVTPEDGLAAIAAAHAAVKAAQTGAREKIQTA